MPSALKKITTRAKAIRRIHGGSWKAAIKKAGAEYRGGRIGSVKRKKAAPKKRRAAVRKIKKFHAAEGRAIKSLGSVSSHLSSAKKMLEHEIGKLEVQRYKAKKKSVKRKIGKRIAAKKSKYRKLC